VRLTQRFLAQPPERRLGYRLLAAIVLAGLCIALVVGGVQVYVDHQRALSAIVLLRQLGPIVAIATGGTFLVALFVLALVGRWVTRPLEEMARYARSLRLDNLSEALVLARAPNSRPDELDHLAAALNDMRCALADELQRRAVVGALRSPVDARTEAPQRANDDLARTQVQLAQADRMASIGVLAAGLAREIDSPIGCLSANLGTLSEYAADLLMLVAAYEGAEAAIGATAPQQLATLRRIKQDLGLDALRADIAGLDSQTRSGLARMRKVVQEVKDLSMSARAAGGSPARISGST